MNGNYKLTWILKDTHGILLPEAESSQVQLCFYPQYDLLLDLSPPPALLPSSEQIARIKKKNNLHDGYCQLVLSQFAEIHLTL